MAYVTTVEERAKQLFASVFSNQATKITSTRSNESAQANAIFSCRNNVFLLDHENVEWLSTLSEDVKLKNLRERIIDVARNERNGLLIFQMGVVLVVSGVLINVLGNNSVAYVAGIFAIVLGTLSTVFGFYVSVHYAHQYNNLLEELDTIS